MKGFSKTYSQQAKDRLGTFKRNQGGAGKLHGGISGGESYAWRHEILAGGFDNFSRRPRPKPNQCGLENDFDFTGGFADCPKADGGGRESGGRRNVGSAGPRGLDESGQTGGAADCRNRVK